MPVITALRPSRRGRHLVSVEIDGAPLAALSEREVERRDLRVGQEVDEETLAELGRSGEITAALNLANSFLAYRPRTGAEVRGRLRRAGHPDEIVDAVMERLIAAGLIDDRRFATLWVENRSTFSPRSARALQAELRRKGIDRETVEETLTVEGNGDESAAALEAGRRRMRAFAGLDEQSFRKRMSGFLARRGFDYEAVSGAVETLWAEAISAHDESADGV